MSTESTTPSWTRRDSRATAAVAVQFAVNGAFFASIMPRLPELRDEIGIDTAAVGLLLTIASTSGLLSSATCKRVIARFGTRRVLATGGLLIAAALLALGQSTSWPMALIALTIMSAFDVYVDVSMNMQGSWLSARRSRPIMNRLHGLWSLGSVIGGLIAARLAASGVSIAAHLGGAAVFLAVLSTVLATQLLPVDEVHADVVDASDDGVSAPQASTHPAWSMFFIAGLTAVSIEIAAINWSAFRLTDDLHRTGSIAALAYVAVMGGMTITRFAGDHLSHLIGAERFTTGSAILALAGLAVAALVDIAPLTIVAFLLAGLGIATLTPRLYDLAARAGGGTAKGLGVLTAGMRLATIVAPVAIATLATRTTVGTAIAISAFVAGVPFIIAATRTRRTA